MTHVSPAPWKHVRSVSAVPTLVRDDVTVVNASEHIDARTFTMFANHVWALNVAYPPANPGDVHVMICPDRYFDHDSDGAGYVGGETATFSAHVRINERVFVDNSPDYSGMPQALVAIPWRYTLNHEWGHAFTSSKDRDLVIMTWGMYGGDLSAYGQTNPLEGYAEAFAEWTLTRGQTDNAAARHYANAFRWHA